MSYWVKAEGAPNSEAFRVAVRPQLSIHTPPLVPQQPSSSSRADEVHVTVGDLLCAAMNFFFPAKKQLDGSSAHAAPYCLFMKGVSLEHRLSEVADDIVDDALNEALDVNETVSNRVGTTLRFALLRRHGVVFELKQKSTATIFTRSPHSSAKKKRVTQSSRPINGTASSPGHEDASRSQTPSKTNKEITSRTSASPPRCALWSPTASPSPTALQRVSQAAATCAAFSPQWKAPKVCVHCHHVAALHPQQIKHSECAEVEPPSSPPRHRRSAATSPAEKAAESVYRRTCDHFVPHWNRNSYCENCFRPASWHTKYIEDLKLKRDLLVDHDRRRRAQAVTRKRLAQIPWHHILGYLPAESISTLCRVNRHLAVAARASLKAVMSLVVTYQIPVDVRARLSRSATVYASALQRAGDRSILAVKLFAAVVASVDSSLRGGEGDSTKLTAASGSTSSLFRLQRGQRADQRSPGAGANNDVALAASHVHLSSLDYSALVEYIKQLADVDPLRLSAAAVNAIEAIPKLPTSPSTGKKNQVRRPWSGDHNTAAKVSFDDVAASQTLHDDEDDEDSGAGRQSPLEDNVDSPSLAEECRPVAHFLQNLVSMRKLKQQAKHYLSNDFVPL